MSKEVNLDTGDVGKMIPAGLKWMYENETLQSPTLLNNLYANISFFPNVSDTEILIDRFNRKMLIYIKFTWMTRNIWKSRKKETTIGILDQLQELLPSFEFRIIEDKALFDLSVARMQKKLFGGEKNEEKSGITQADVDALSATLTAGGPPATNGGPNDSTGVSTQVPATEGATEPIVDDADPAKPPRA